MPALPWYTPRRPAPEAAVVAMASRLEARSFRAVPRFLLRSFGAWNQARKAPGCLGVSLLAEPLRRTFWTLSAWESRAALASYAAAEPHRSAVAALRPATRDARMVFWDVKGEQVPLSWREARRRVAEQPDGAGTPGGSPRG